MKHLISTLLILHSLMTFANTHTANDNTAKNSRDRTGRTLLPRDQSNNENDLASAVKIRSSLFKNDELSTYGKNVKVIVLNNVVTLRGPVNSFTEKQRVADTAILAMPGMKIRNKLEVVK